MKYYVANPAHTFIVIPGLGKLRPGQLVKSEDLDKFAAKGILVEVEGPGVEPELSNPVKEQKPVSEAKRDIKVEAKPEPKVETPVQQTPVLQASAVASVPLESAATVVPAVTTSSPNTPDEEDEVKPVEEKFSKGKKRVPSK